MDTLKTKNPNVIYVRTKQGRKTGLESVATEPPRPSQPQSDAFKIREKDGLESVATEPPRPSQPQSDPFKIREEDGPRIGSDRTATPFTTTI
ncbi:MAG: hypothetical protein R2822_05355 [Spirosomataceae bacterium]